MARSALLNTVADFAHLMGRPAKPATAAAPVPKPAAAKDDDDKPMDDDKTSRAAGDDDGDDDGETEEEKKKRKKEEEDDEDREDKDDEKDAKATAARGRERARCRAIFASKDAAARPDMAAHLAFNTPMSRGEACRTLAAIVAGQPKGAAYADRMAGMETIRPGADGGRTAAPSRPAMRVGTTPRPGSA